MHYDDFATLRAQRVPFVEPSRVYLFYVSMVACCTCLARLYVPAPAKDASSSTSPSKAFVHIELFFPREVAAKIMLIAETPQVQPTAEHDQSVNGDGRVEERGALDGSASAIISSTESPNKRIDSISTDLLVHHSGDYRYMYHVGVLLAYRLHILSYILSRSLTCIYVICQDRGIVWWKAISMSMPCTP
jgi:hypothetical protein